MKHKLTKEEIAKVFAMYWGQEYHVCFNIEKNPVCGVINENTIGDIEPDLVNVRDLLLLKPLSDITDEDANIIFNMATGGDNWEFKIERTKSETIGIYEDIRCILWSDVDLLMLDRNTLDGAAVETQQSGNIFQHLVSNGYAVPLYFGVGHWANGKNAIELNIAVNVKSLSRHP